jgi:hypothetical protein
MPTFSLDKSTIKVISQYWEKIAPFILEWKTNYQWPKNTSYQDAIKIRNELEEIIKRDLTERGFLSKRVVDKIFLWGFNKRAENNEKEIAIQTQKAFTFLSQNLLRSAAIELTQLKGVGISRATKIIALSNQDDFAIYDSRTGHALRDLTIHRKRMLLIPVGRVIPGDKGISSNTFCNEFVKYTAVIQELRNLAKNEPFAKEFRRASDIELYLFSRSRRESKQDNTEHSKPERDFTDSKRNIENNHNSEENHSISKNTFYTEKLFTLSKGARAKAFWVEKEKNQFVVKTGIDGNSAFKITFQEIEKLLQYFSIKEWFPLGNSVDNLTQGGLGEYVRYTLKQSAKNASHIASILVHIGLMEFSYGIRNSIDLKVKKGIHFHKL